MDAMIASSRRDSTASRLGTPVAVGSGAFRRDSPGGQVASSVAGTAVDDVLLTPLGVQEALGPNDAPMTYSQASLHFVNSLDPAGVTYTCVFGLELRAPFDATVLRDALHALLLRHSSLRTQFCTVADEPVQRVVPVDQATLDFAERDILQALGDGASDRVRAADESEEDFYGRVRKAWKRVLMKENHTPFDITKGPVFRARLFRASLPPEEGDGKAPRLVRGISYGILHLMAHHIAVDGWSMELLTNELHVLYAEIYRARAEKRKADAEAEASAPSLPVSLVDELLSYLAVLPPVGHTMQERALAERALLASPDGERQWNFWQRTLAPPLTLLELHTDFPRPPLQTYKGDVYHFSLPSDLVDGLRSLAKQEKVTMFMLLCSSFVLLMHRYTGQDDVCVGTPMACRTDMNYERTVGHMVNPCVLRTSFAAAGGAGSELTLSQLLDRVKRATIAAFVNQDYPFPLLVDRLQSFRDASRNPLFQVLFSLNQKFQATQAAASGMAASGDDGANSALSVADGQLHGSVLADLDQLVSPFDLQLIMTESASSLKADLTYNTSLFTYASMQRMGSHLLTLWRSMVSAPPAEAKIALLPMLPQEEVTMVLEGFNRPMHGLKEYYMVDIPKNEVLEALADPVRARDELRLNNRFDSFERLSDRHCVHKLFELQTRLTPAAIAVVEYESFPSKYVTVNSGAKQHQVAKPARPSALFPAGSSTHGKQQEPRTFSYAKLNERANSLAHYMRSALGVRTGDVVVLLFYRCADWLVALLAALKCGAAYVPVDPAYPGDRIKYMMADAKAKVLLTHFRAREVLAALNKHTAQIASMDSAERAAAGYRGPFPPILALDAVTSTAPAPTVGGASVVMVDAQWSDISLFEVVNPEVDVRLAHLCYLVYTSGSTGKPKGVMLSHRSMYLIARWHQLEYAISEEDRVTQQTAPAFDPVGLELWSTWFAGASLHIVPDAVRGNPPALQNFLIEHKLTVAFMPTPICANLIDEPWPSPADPAHVPLRVLTTGGDRLVRGPLASNPLPPGVRLDNWYGPSENTIISTFFRVPPGFPGAPPIGRPVDNVRIYIVDKHMRPCGVGIAGDIYVGGDALAVGYLNRPDLTEEKFRPNVFRLTEHELKDIQKQEEEAKKAREAEQSAAASASPPVAVVPVPAANGTATPPVGLTSPGRVSVTSRGSISSPSVPRSSPGASRPAGKPAPPVPTYPRMYESGDVGRWLPDGSVEFIGRRDFQVKIRGFRIELGEIESVLVKHDKVSKVVVQVKSKGQGHQALAAYVVLHPQCHAETVAPGGSAALVDELRAFSKQTLPEYMVPSVFVFLPRLPETANGKIDLKALPEPVWTGAGGGGGGGAGAAGGAAAIVEPRNEIESKLCATWCALLSLSSISIHDNFFELGGNSLSAARLLSAIKRVFDVELNVSLLFHAPTVAGVADKIAFLKREGSLAEYDAHAAAAAGAAAAGKTAAGEAAEGAKSTSAAVVPLDFDTFDLRKEVVLDPSICNPRVDFRQLTQSTASPLSTPNAANGASGGTPVASPSNEVRVVSALLHHPKSLFLTGVTGFLGVHLLAALLEQTDAVVHCLLRHNYAKDSRDPLARIVEHATDYKLWDPTSAKGKAYAARIRPVLGDLSAPRLGVNAAEWSRLSSELDGVFHCGAFVNSVLPYSQLKAANVGGTHEVLRLATAGGKIKTVHHISTLSVFQGVYSHKLTELQPLTGEGLSAASGYPTSKFVAEQLVLAAARRGLPVAIHRPGRITGHSRTGCTSLDDFFTRLLKGCVQLGAFPDLDWNCDLTPVDWMANSIVHLALHRHALPSPVIAEQVGFPLQPCAVYHLHNPAPIHFVKLAEWLIREHRYPARLLPYEKWLAELKRAVESEPTATGAVANGKLQQGLLTAGNASAGIPRVPAIPNVLAPLMTVFGPTRESMGTVAVMPAFNSRFTLDAIVQAKGKPCPAPDAKLLQTYFHYFNESKFM